MEILIGQGPKRCDDCQPKQPLRDLTKQLRAKNVRVGCDGLEVGRGQGPRDPRVSGEARALHDPDGLVLLELTGNVWPEGVSAPPEPSEDIAWPSDYSLIVFPTGAIGISPEGDVGQKDQRYERPDAVVRGLSGDDVHALVQRGGKSLVEPDESRVTCGQLLWITVSRSDRPDDPLKLCELFWPYSLDSRWIPIGTGMVRCGSIREDWQAQWCQLDEQFDRTLVAQPGIREGHQIIRPRRACSSASSSPGDVR